MTSENSRGRSEVTVARSLSSDAGDVTSPFSHMSRWSRLVDVDTFQFNHHKAYPVKSCLVSV